jgi:hypothetical protein
MREKETGIFFPVSFSFVNILRKGTLPIFLLMSTGAVFCWSSSILNRQRGSGFLGYAAGIFMLIAASMGFGKRARKHFTCEG